MNSYHVKTAMAGLAVLATLLIACGSGDRNAARTPVASPPSSLETTISSVDVNGTIASQYTTPAVQVSGPSGGTRVLTDQSGYTLYVFSEDVPASGNSQCTGTCASKWPPLEVPYGPGFQIPGLGPFGTFRRSDDGQRQVMYRGRPLYRYSGDKAPGDMNGAGVDSHWSIATP